MSTIVTRGTASAQALGYASASSAYVPTYVEDVFSTYLYTGTGAELTIVNGIDLATKGGMVWLKRRTDTSDHYLYDTVRGLLKDINSNSTAAEASIANTLTAFNNDGFSIGSSVTLNDNKPYVAWTFRKQPKFFDVVTYTGTGVARTIAHNLGSVPGCIMVKRTDTTSDWRVYHRSLTSAVFSLKLNTTDAQGSNIAIWNSTAPTDSVFNVGNSNDINTLGGTYIAYLFAHDAGGFGELGTDNIISCGSYIGNSATVGPITTLGYEPQFLLVKNISSTTSANWTIIDTTREFSAGLVASTTHNRYLSPNLSSAETAGGYVIPQSTGFQIYGGSNTGGAAAQAMYNNSDDVFIYIAIRRGPMRAPTTGSEVLELVARTGTGVEALVPATNLTDFAIIKNRTVVASPTVVNRITRNGTMLANATSTEANFATFLPAHPWDVIGGVEVATDNAVNASGPSYINYLMSRAPQFLDVFSYIFPATLVANTRIPHNLTIPPEMIIAKSRTGATGWYVYHKNIGLNAYVRLNVNNTQTTASGIWGATAPTATDFGVNPASIVTASATATFQLFATCPGVSKVGGYTGAGVGTPQQIDCGFTTGARFVLIKVRTGVAADWYLWDSARGIISGNDPYFLLNSTNAEVTNTDYIDTYSAGFELTATAPAALNNVGYNYIFLAIA